MVSFAFIHTGQYLGMVATAVGLAALSSGPASVASVAALLFLAVVNVGVFYFLYKIGTQGMTLRHFLFGYKVVNAQDGAYPSIFKLYFREVVAYAAGMVWVMKMMLPGLIKASTQSLDGKNDHHIVMAKGNDLYVSNKSIGDMRADQAYHESRANTQKELMRLAEVGFFHDKIFGTCAVMASRAEVMASFKKSTLKASVTDFKKAA
jgi:hypothetical protein